jgi:beta-lactamase regulating signal transducer with metallopeptidase domain
VVRPQPAADLLGGVPAVRHALRRRFQSGVINDYITWLVTGVAVLGGILAIIIR